MSLRRSSLPVALTICAMLVALGAGHRVRQSIEMGSWGSSRPLVESMDGQLASAEIKGVSPDTKGFFDLITLLDTVYVDELKDKSELGAGAVRGMINRLEDPDSQYYDKEGFARFQGRLKGEFEGVGVVLRTDLNPAVKKAAEKEDEEAGDPLLMIPDLLIADVIPDSPAEQAGLKPGDRILGVNGKFLLSGGDVKALRDLQERADGDPKAAEALEKMRKSLEDRVEESTSIAKAAEWLMTGREGKISMEVQRGTDAAKTFSYTIPKGAIQLPAVTTRDDGTWSLNLISGASKELALALESGEPKVLDLTTNFGGDPREVLAVLQLLAPGQDLGAITNQGGRQLKELKTTGESKPIAFKVRANKNLHGAQAILARALVKAGATLEGQLPDAPDHWIEAFTLADGSGYTLVTGLYGDLKSLVKKS